MNQQPLFEQLDKAEERLLNRWDRWLDQAYKSIAWDELERLKRSGGPNALNRIPALVNTNPGALARILSDHAAEMIGAGQAHAQILVDDLHQRLKGRRLADYAGFDFEYGDDPRVIPEKAVRAMELRSIRLAGDVDGDLLAGVKKIMIRFLTGDTRRETERALEELLDHNRDRASLITTTETTYSYNRGRLAGFAENQVDYVRFSAVMDRRTSPICRSRHGLIMKMDDPRVADNTPPLHGRCRSVLDPLYSAYQPELIIERNLDWSNVAPLPPGWKAAA